MELFDRRGKPIRHARDIRYDNFSSGLTAEDVQSAIDEVLAGSEELAQDAVGTILFDSDSILFDYDPLTPMITAEIDESFEPIWTGDHTWTDNVEVRLGTGGDLRLFHDGTDSVIENSTGVLRIDSTGTSTIKLLESATTPDVRIGDIVTGTGTYFSTADTIRIAGVGAGLRVLSFGANPAISFGRANGTALSPSAVLSGQNLGQFNFLGAIDTVPNVFAAARFRAVATEDYTGSVRGTKLEFLSTATGTTALSITAAFLGTQVQFLGGTVLLPSIAFQADPNSGLYSFGADSVGGAAGGLAAIRWDSNNTAGNTRLLVYDVDNAAVERVTVGAADSAGVGFKVLRIPN